MREGGVCDESLEGSSVDAARSRWGEVAHRSVTPHAVANVAFLWGKRWSEFVHEGSTGIMESEIVACGIQRKIGVELPAERDAVLSGSENNEKSVRADELTGGEHPFPRSFRVICQAVASEINLGSGIEDFDPVGRVPVRVI